MQQDIPHLRTSAVISFVVTALIASILLVSVIVLLLGELIGSHILAMAILGVVIALVSWAIYHWTIAPVFRSIEIQIDSIRTLVNSVQRACQCAIDRVIAMIIKKK